MARFLFTHSAFHAFYPQKPVASTVEVMAFTINPTNPMNEYGAREETRAFQNDRENQMRDMAKWPCNHSLTLMDAARICYAGNPELLARLERANKIDRLKAELAIKAEELRQAQLAEAYEGVEEQEMTEADSEAFLKQLHADKLAELGTESRAVTPKLNPHDE